MTGGERRYPADGYDQNNYDVTVVCPDSPPLLDSPAAKALMQLILRHAREHRSTTNRIDQAQRIDLESLPDTIDLSAQRTARAPTGPGRTLVSGTSPRTGRRRSNDPIRIRRTGIDRRSTGPQRLPQLAARPSEGPHRPSWTNRHRVLRRRTVPVCSKRTVVPPTNPLPEASCVVEVRPVPSPVIAVKTCEGW